MPSARIQRYDVFARGTNLAVEPERLRPVEFKRAINIDVARDGMPETAPGYAVEFELPKRRQIATMEDAEDTEWAGDAVDDATNKIFGFQSRKHEHTASDTADTSTFTPPTDFLDFLKDSFLDDEATAGDVQFKFWFEVDDVSEISTIRVRFRKDATHYFEGTIPVPAADGVAEVTSLAFTDFAVVGAPALTWDEIVDVQVITTPIGANGVVDVSFDDFFVEDLTQSEPITGLHSFEIPIAGNRFLMATTSDMIYSVAGAVFTKRAARLGRQRPVHFATANDYVFMVNDNDIPQRWDPDEPAFREVGVPVPPSGMTGAGAISAPVGLVPPGDYSAKVTFGMGPHGEGNPSAQTTTFAVSGAQDSIQYASVPIGPPGTVRRIIYRSAKDTTDGPWFLDISIEDNTTTGGAAALSKNSDTVILASAQVQTDGAQPIVLKYIAEANSTLFGVPSTRPSRIRHSDVTRQPNRTIEQWDELNEIDIDPDDGDIITGFLKHKEFVYPFKRLSTYLVDPRILAPQKISAIYGSISQRVIHDAGEKAYFWSARFGPMRLSGNRIVEIGKQLRDLDGRPLGVTGINESVLIPKTRTQAQKHETTSKADWDLGTLTDMNSTDTVGSIANNRGTATDFSKDFARSSEGASVVESITDATNIASPVSSVIDGIIGGAGPLYFKDDFFAAVASTAQITVTVTSKIYNHIKLDIVAWKELFGSLKVEALVGASFVQVANYSSYGSLPLSETDELAFGIPGVILKKEGLLSVPISPVTATKFRITYTSLALGLVFNTALPAGVNDSRRRLFAMTEFQAFEQAFITNGTWESQDIDLGVATIARWGAFLADVTLNGGNVTFQIKTGATAGALATALYQTVIPGLPPDPAVIVPRRHVKIKVLVTALTTTSPRLDSIILSFVSLETEILGTLVESNGMFFEDKFWSNLVRRDDDLPGPLWKVGYFEESMEHDDYAMSCWAIHDGALLSGSAVDGKVFRHVRDINGIRLTSKDGRPIVTEMEPANNALGEQMVEKTVRDFILAARNESEKFQNILLNEDFEEVVGSIDPVNISSATAAGWDQNASSSTKTAKLVSVETDRINVFSRSVSMVLDGTFLELFEAFISQDVALENSTDYVIEFFAKTIGPPAELKITTAGGLILGSDGTWLSTNSPIVIADTLGVYEKQQFGFRTLTDIENRLPVEVRFRYKSTVTEQQGTTFLDLVSLKRAQTRDRKVEITPIADGVLVLPAKVIDLVDDRDGIVKARGRIDRAGVRNMSYRIRTETLDSGFKFLGLVTSFALERVRSGG